MDHCAFGGAGRAYVYTEPIYQGQTYTEAVRTEELGCWFEVKADTDIDGLIYLPQVNTKKVSLC